MIGAACACVEIADHQPKATGVVTVSPGPMTRNGAGASAQLESQARLAASVKPSSRLELKGSAARPCQQFQPSAHQSALLRTTKHG